MKQAFAKCTMRADSLELVRDACRVIDRYEAAGYKLSLRQLYYQLVAANIIPNNEKSYNRVGAIIADARMCGLCDWDMIEDRNRQTVTPPHWKSPQEIIDMAARSFRIDKWADQPNYCEVMVEKQALEGVLEPVCNELDVPFTANKGYSSVTMMYEIGQRIIRKFRERMEARGLMPDKFKAEGRPFKLVKWMIDQGYLEEYLPFRLSEKGIAKGFPRIVIFYMGDHDPSGIDMTRDVQDRLKTFSDFTPIEVRRLALNMDQVEELNPPENPAKMTDSRAQSYVEKFGSSSWELDAVEPEAMAQMVRDAVLSIRDEETWDQACQREDTGRDYLDKLAKRPAPGTDPAPPKPKPKKRKGK